MRIFALNYLKYNRSLNRFVNIQKKKLLIYKYCSKTLNLHHDLKITIAI